jgi:hypothetical protein
LGPGYRSTTFGNYVIFLRYADEVSSRGHLYIVHVLHGARDMDAYFGSTQTMTGPATEQVWNLCARGVGREDHRPAGLNLAHAPCDYVKIPPADSSVPTCPDPGWRCGWRRPA